MRCWDIGRLCRYLNLRVDRRRRRGSAPARDLGQPTRSGSRPFFLTSVGRPSARRRTIIAASDSQLWSTKGAPPRRRLHLLITPVRPFSRDMMTSPVHHLLQRSLSTSAVRHAAAAAASSTAFDKPKKPGSIADVFSSLSGGAVAPLPAKYAELKRELWRDGMADRWREVLADLERTTAKIQATGPEVRRCLSFYRSSPEADTSFPVSQIVPRLPFEQIKRGEIDPDLVRRIKETGTVIVEGVQTEEQALQWQAEILAYADRNKAHVTGFPADNLQVFELYNTKPQREAQTHPNTILTHRFLLSGLLHASDPASKISLRPIVYGDRLRVRQPGDTVRSRQLSPMITLCNC